MNTAKAAAVSDVAVIGAGTTLSFEDPENEGEYLLLEGARTIGATGEQGEFVETTPISSTTRTYIPGLKTPPDKEIVGNDIPGDTNQETFLELARSNSTVNMKVEYSNGRLGDFVIALAGFQINDATGSDALQWTVYGKQSGDVAWTQAVMGVSVSPSTADLEVA